MRFPVVTKCCCGCSLETGCKIIGYTQLICGALLFLIQMAALLSSDFVSTQNTGHAVGSVFSCMMGTMLLQAIRTKNPNRIHIYVITSCVFWILGMIGMFILSFFLMADLDVSIGMFMLGVSVILGLIQAYFITVVYNYKFQMIQEGQQDETI